MFDVTIKNHHAFDPPWPGHQMNLFNHIPWRSLRRKVLPDPHTWMSSRTPCLLAPPGRMGTRMVARVMARMNPRIPLRWGGVPILCFIIYYCSQIVGKSLLNFLQPRIPRFLFWNMVPIHSPSCFVFSCPSLEGSWWQWWAHWTACRIADGRHSPWTAFSKVSPGFARGEGATFRMKRKLPNAFQENNWIEFMRLW